MSRDVFHSHMALRSELTLRYKHIYSQENHFVFSNSNWFYCLNPNSTVSTMFTSYKVNQAQMFSIKLLRKRLHTHTHRRLRLIYHFFFFFYSFFFPQHISCLQEPLRQNWRKTKHQYLASSKKEKDLKFRYEVTVIEWFQNNLTIHSWQSRCCCWLFVESCEKLKCGL